MRFIPTLTHGLLDYLMGGFLIAAPWLIGFADGGAETWIPMVLGASALLYSIFTDYEMGMVRRLPMPTHLSLDLGAGLLLAASPWLLGFADEVWMPHLALGLLEAGAALVTKTTPGYAVVPGVAEPSPRLRKGFKHRFPGSVAGVYANKDVEETRQTIALFHQQKKETSKGARRYEA